ncbi:hypothetical protein KVV02_002564 [Mortierella alpina]|uniref:Beta-hexosaminidase n=1 Tax=Mortierella alpina TaxID=64518 RepID=A0A9P8A3S5_MORAP|nr:hypothetical protein KVV02_002564 [Mortierella alpina]
MIRAAMYSISAAIALASNAFLVSLLLFPDRAPVSGHLWPKPAHVCQGHRTIQLSSHFKFHLPEDASQRLLTGAERYRNRILSSHFISPVPVNPILAEKEDRSQVQDVVLETVKIEIEDSSSNEPLGLDSDESYKLLIAADEDPDEPFGIKEDDCEVLRSRPRTSGVTGVIRARTMYGAFHGMETLTQLVTNNPQDNTKEIARTPIRIHDRPLFKHRGVLIDTSRNFLSLASLYRTIDGLAMNKFNVLHWHIIDSQSFPIVLDDQKDPQETEDGDTASDDDKSDQHVLRLSDLASKGAYSSDMTYTKDDISSLVAYAMDRGVRVIPELDMPGHAWAWSQAFPEITSCLDGYPSYSRFSAEPPSGQLNPAEPKTFKVIQGVYDQVLPLFEDSYVHAGADEVNINCWNNTQSIIDLMNRKGIPRSEDGFDRILDGFLSKQHKMLRTKGKTPIVWEEPLLNHALTTLSQYKDTVVQVWTSADNIKTAIQKGHRVITGSADYWYLDCGYGDWLGNWTLGRSWCDPYKSWQKIYSFNPLMGLSPKEAESVLGGEALLWGEQVDDTNLDSKLWPRASAAAEVLWSGNSEESSTKLWDGPKQTENSLRSIEALDRINEHRFRMLSQKIRAEPLQPMWCVQNPGHCLWPIYDTKPAEQPY